MIRTRNVRPNPRVAAIILACAFFTAPCAAADADLFPALSCDLPEANGPFTYCSVVVPNGTFTGPGKSWFSSGPEFGWAPSEPSVASHIAPWRIHGKGAVGFPLKGKGTPGIALMQSGAVLWQAIDVPRQTGEQVYETTYLVKITYRTEAPVDKPVGMRLKVFFGEAGQIRASHVFTHSQAGTERAPASFVTRMTVPAYTPFSKVLLGISKTDGESSLVIQDVQLIQSEWAGLE